MHTAGLISTTTDMLIQKKVRENYAFYIILLKKKNETPLQTLHTVEPLKAPLTGSWNLFFEPAVAHCSNTPCYADWDATKQTSLLVFQRFFGVWKWFHLEFLCFRILRWSA